MKKIILFACLMLSIITYGKQNAKSILVFSKTAGFRHESIATGKKMFLELGAKNNVHVDTTEDAAAFTDDNLKKYSAVVFLNTTGNVLDTFQQIAFTKFIENGGGFVGIHAATDTEYDWPWYNKLVGAQFDSHPYPQHARFNVVDKNFPATANLPDTMSRFEELYNFKSLQKDILHFLITVDESSYKEGKMGSFHPMSWYHNYDGGKAFYLELGHHPETYSDTTYQQIVWKGLQWAMK